MRTRAARRALPPGKGSPHSLKHNRAGQPQPASASADAADEETTSYDGDIVMQTVADAIKKSKESVFKNPMLATDDASLSGRAFGTCGHSAN